MQVQETEKYNAAVDTIGRKMSGWLLDSELPRHLSIPMAARIKAIDGNDPADKLQQLRIVNIELTGWSDDPDLPDNIQKEVMASLREIDTVLRSAPRLARPRFA